MLVVDTHSMQFCACEDPLSGAICSLADEPHHNLHRDESDRSCIIEFGDPPTLLAVKGK